MPDLQYLNLGRRAAPARLPRQNSNIARDNRLFKDPVPARPEDFIPRHGWWQLRRSAQTSEWAGLA
jgi:hypothetical protein